MLEKLFPKERDLFPLMNQLVLGLSSAVSELLELADRPEDLEKVASQTRILDGRADVLARQCIVHLHETFITPFDRKHIFHFVNQVRDLTYRVRFVTEKLYAYNFTSIPLEFIELAAKSGEACAVLKQISVRLQNIKSPQETIQLCLEIYKIRAESEDLYFNSSTDLYARESDIKKLLKTKEVNDDLIGIIRKFEGLSLLVEEIILEYA